jgi:hypothetical protein
MTTPTLRGYDRTFDWSYSDTGPLPSPGRGLIPVVLDGLWLNTGDLDSGLCAVVTNIEGWLDSPPVSGNDVARTISDGAAWGPKVLGPRTIVIHGAAAGPRDELGSFRAQLAARAAHRDPVLLSVGTMDGATVQTADVRAGTDSYRHQPLGSSGFRWQLTLTAADPAIYDGTWQAARLTNVTEGAETGRGYPRPYPWQYAGSYVPNSAVLRNAGNHAAPVYALYEGDMTESTLSDGHGGIIRLAALDAGVTILVSTATLIAEAPGGLSRASFILPGSRPMTLPPVSTGRWYLRATGRGAVSLGWRSAWV